MGRLDFAEELELRSALAGTTLRHNMQNTAFAAQPSSFFMDSAWSRRYGEDAETPLAPLLEWNLVQKKASTRREMAIAISEESRAAQGR